MSKQDSHFFNIFGMVLGILIAVALILFGVSRAVGNVTQREQVYADPEYTKAVALRIAAPARVAVAGQDNSALAIVADTPDSAGSALPVPEDAAALYEAVCKTCHGAGIAGAPKVGDKAAWAPRIAQGADTLHRHSIEGYTGKAGVMPAKGGRADLADELIAAGVDYMVERSR